MPSRLRRWPWLTMQIIVANVAIILALATVWYLLFVQQSDVYSARLMSTFNIEPGQLHAMSLAFLLIGGPPFKFEAKQIASMY